MSPNWAQDDCYELVKSEGDQAVKITFTPGCPAWLIRSATREAMAEARRRATEEFT